MYSCYMKLTSGTEILAGRAKSIARCQFLIVDPTMKANPNRMDGSGWVEDADSNEIVAIIENGKIHLEETLHEVD